MTIRDLSDYEFGRYEEGVIKACRENLSGPQLEHEIKRAAMKYVASFLELNERAKILARGTCTKLLTGIALTMG